MPLPPSLSPDQRQAALEKAAAARRQRAELKEKLKMGSTSLDELLSAAEHDEVVAKMKVVTVLESLPEIGKVEARDLMGDLDIPDARRVQGLGRQQRAGLRSLLELRQLGRGRSVSIRSVLERADTDETLGNLKLSAVLRAIGRGRRTTVAEKLRRVSISETRKCRGLGPDELARVEKEFS